MTATLADFWTVLCPSLPNAWDTPSATARLLTAATHMAPVPRIGFECRLGAEPQQIDLQQCITDRDNEPALLRDFIAATHAATLTGDGAWDRLLRFATAWADPATVLHAGVPEVFLEYDLDDAPTPSLTPSIFFAVGEHDAPPARAEAVAFAALEQLLATAWPDGLADNLRRCFAACRGRAFVSYLGAMLGRTEYGLRVNIKGVALDELLPLLEDVGWAGDPAPVERWAAWAYDVADRVTVCLDVGPVVYPHLGLECMVVRQPGYEPKWAAALDELTNAGLATNDNASAWLALPAALLPVDDEVRWPGKWIADSLLAPTTRFSTVERRLSHFKLTLIGDHAVAKGYWGAGHVWRDRAAPETAPPAPSDRTVEQTLTDAIAFLVAQQANTGRWCDFHLPAGPSDEWVTAFVGTALAATDRDEGHSAAVRAWDALARRRSDDDGWGYNRVTPTDADSTAWALRLARALGATTRRVENAARFLATHVYDDGGVTTYAERGPILEYTQLPDDASMAGWQMTHACVSAAAAPLLDESVTQYLRRLQAPAGNWTSYWWWDDEYTTALAAAAAPDTAPRAAAWAATRVPDTGAVASTDGEVSPWATAWSVRILGLGTGPDVEDARQRAIRWLLATQRDDGSWEASARLRVPMPAHLDPEGELKRIESIDAARVFTTAAVVAALAECQ